MESKVQVNSLEKGDPYSQEVNERDSVQLRALFLNGTTMLDIISFLSVIL